MAAVSPAVSSNVLSPSRDLVAPAVAVPTLALAVASVGAFVSLAWLGATGRLPVPLVVVLQGLAAFASFTPMHDASHRSVARAAPLNEFVGWVTALVLTAPFPAFRHLHLEHHRNTNDPARDPDMWSGAGGPWSRLFRWATQDIAYYVFYAKRAKERPRGEVFGTFVGLVLTYAPMVALAALGHGREALLFWAVPARLGIILLAFAFDWLPHHPHAVLGRTDPFRATAVIEHRFLTPILLSQNYHLIHHLFPGVPFYGYGRVWWARRGELVSRGALVRRIGPAGAKEDIPQGTGDTHALTVSRVVDEARGTKSFELAVPEALRPVFRHAAGQFTTVEVVVDGEVLRRSYSFSRRSVDGSSVRITVKRIPGGRVSAFLHTNVHEGDVVRVSAPRGRFVLRESSPGTPVVCFAAGSGITPIRAIAEEALVKTERPVRLFASSRDRASVVFEAELRELEARFGERLRVTLHVDDEHGLPTPEALERVLGSGEPEVYVCGPAPFQGVVDELLDAHAVPSSRRFSERFAAAPRKGERPRGCSGALRVREGERVRLVTVHEGETLLEASRRAGLRLAASCEEGYCGSCAVRLSGGTVTMRANDALDDATLAEGMILPCQAVLDTNGQEVEIDVSGPE
jgi:ferredoxin-NADP reductase/fatty acid desaturase